MVGLQRIFNMMDDDNSGSLSEREFWKACKDFKVGISEENVPTLFKIFDKNGDGTMGYDEFLSTLRGKLSPTRSHAIRTVYKSLADRCGGTFTVDYVKKIYSAGKHLDVVHGKRTEDNALVEFIETFEAHHNLGGEDANVSEEEWEDYFHSLSAIEDNDNVFVANLNNVFGLHNVSPKKAQGGPSGPNQAQAGRQQPNEADIRPSAKPSNVLRSGMMSNNNPISTTLEYYPKVNTATRGVTSTEGMFQSVQEQTEIAKPRQDYASYKNKPVNTDFIKVSEIGKTVPKYQTILVQRFRKALRERGGRGISGLSRQFKIFDDNGNGTLEMDEFIKAIHDYQLDIEAIDIQNLFKTMDLDNSGAIDFNEFIRVIVGEMGQNRQTLVIKAFQTLDINNDGEVSLEEFQKKYDANNHPDVRSGKRTQDEVLIEFMETFQSHHNSATTSKRDNKISIDEFIEYYNHISCSIDSDSYFDTMITNAWGLTGDLNNPNNLPFAGTAQKINHVNSREAYRQDHHRNLFGTDKVTPFSKDASSWATSSKMAHNGYQGQGNQAAGTAKVNQDNYKVDYTGVKHTDDELVVKVREMLARRGARGMIGLQRIFKIMDDNGSNTLDIQEFWKAIKDFRVKISQDEARHLFTLFDEDGNDELSIDEFLLAIRGQLSDFRRGLIKQVYDKLDRDKNGILDYEDLKDVYNAKNHPDVKAGKKTEEEIVQDFLETFEVHRTLSRGDTASKKNDGKVSLNEFCDYYSNVSASIDDDQYFKLMITNAWNLDNKSHGKAWGAEY